jgi:prepilin-type N-terminal cleavage/methylation domain-containing protein
MASGSGFSLLELIIVLSLISILAGIGVLEHQALRPRLNLALAARQVVMDLRMARMHAVTDHVNHRIVFPSDSRTYQAQRKSGHGYSDEGMPVFLPEGIVIADCTARDHSISFVPRGNAGSFGTIKIRNTKGEERQVSVDIAGQVRVY